MNVFKYYKINNIMVKVMYTRQYLLSFKDDNKHINKNIKYNLESLDSIFNKPKNNIELITRNITSIFNKLSNDNFDKLSKQLEEYVLPESYEIFVNKLHESCILQPTFCKLYVKLYDKFYNEDIEHLLMNSINYYFTEYNSNVKKRKYLMQYIGELFNNGYVTINQVDNFYKVLLSDNDIESLCLFLRSIKDKIDVSKYLLTLSNMKQSLEKTNIRLMFMIMDLEDLI